MFILMSLLCSTDQSGELGSFGEMNESKGLLEVSNKDMQKYQRR